VSAPAPIRVLVVDDHPVVRDGLRTILERQPDITVVAEAGTGEGALEEFRRHRPDVTLMDLRLRGMSGLEATERLCRDFPGSRVLVLSTYQIEEEIYRALRAGARGYLLKDASREQLLSAVRAVHHGHRPIAPEAVDRLAARLPGCDLTPRELDVLRLLVRGKSNKEIGASLALTEGTVKGYLHDVFGKMGVGDRTEAATEALRRGLVPLADPPTPSER
jgi:two-component system NarL family response regulator